MNRKKRKRHKRLCAISCYFLISTLLISGGYPFGMVSYATVQEEQAEETSEVEKSTVEESKGSVTSSGTADASVSKARKDAKEAEQNKKAAQRILDNLKTAKENIEDYIIELDKSLNEMQIEISHLEQTQKELQETIEKTTKELEIARKAWTDQYAAMKVRIQMVYESGNKRYLDVLLSASSMTDILNKNEYAMQVSLYDYNVLKELKHAKEQVANLKQKLDKDLEVNETMQIKVNAQKDTMEALVEEKSKQVEQYEISIAGQTVEVEKYAKAQAEAEAIIAAAEQVASSSSTSTYTGGTFTWPAPGNNTITSYFGNRTSPLPGASSNHRGIDISCNTGDPIVAAASGTVIVATYNAAEGNYICVDHGGGVVTVYMHNSQLHVSVGEMVTTGQTIASAGSTGYSTGPHCHFGVRVDGVYVDPLGYLQ